jgi:hypothetical protein
MGIDGVEAQAGSRFACLVGVSGDGEPGVAITLLALGGAAQNVVLAVAAAAEVLGVVQARVKGFDPVSHQVRSTLVLAGLARPPIRPDRERRAYS